MSLRDSFGDAFITLPLLLLGFVFLFGTLTSNTGLLLLFIGQIILVPILGFFGNYDDAPFATAITGASTVIGSAIFYAVHSGAISSLAGSNGWGFMSTPVIIVMLQYVVRNFYKEDKILSKRSHFDIINPAKWFGVQSITLPLLRTVASYLTKRAHPTRDPPIG